MPVLRSMRRGPRARGEPMAARRLSSSPAGAPSRPLASRVREAMASLRGLASKKHRDGLARFAIPTEHALGVPMGAMQRLAKDLGRDPALAQGLWDTGVYEARTLAAFVDDPALVTPAQMDRWCRDFDNWAICDTVCFHLFDKTPHA